jgi:hypothetical protein
MLGRVSGLESAFGRWAHRATVSFAKAPSHPELTGRWMKRRPVFFWPAVAERTVVGGGGRGG